MGRGVEAAAVMGQLRAALRAYAMVEQRPGAVLSLLDAAVSSLEQSAITTCLYGVLDPRTRRLRIASAGHLPPLLVHPDGGGEYLELEPGPPLGVAWEAPRETELVLPEGSVLLLYTDGLVEDRHQSVEEGMLRLRNGVAGAVAAHARPAVRPAAARGRPRRAARRRLRPARRVHPAAAGPALPAARSTCTSPATCRRSRAPGTARRSGRRPRAPTATTSRCWSPSWPATRCGTAAPASTCGCAATPTGLRVECVDGRGAAPPRVQDPDDDAEGGRGLVLVQALADRWGSDRLTAGKSVWFEVDVPPPS